MLPWTPCKWLCGEGQLGGLLSQVRAPGPPSFSRRCGRGAAPPRPSARIECGQLCGWTPFIRCGSPRFPWSDLDISTCRGLDTLLTSHLDLRGRDAEQQAESLPLVVTPPPPMSGLLPQTRPQGTQTRGLAWHVALVWGRAEGDGISAAGGQSLTWVQAASEPWSWPVTGSALSSGPLMAIPALFRSRALRVEP